MNDRVSKILAWLRRDFKWMLLLAIPVVVGVIAFLSHHDFMGMSHRLVLKSKLEVVHPALLVCFTLVSFVGWRKYETRACGAMAILGSAFVMREIHFEGSDYLMGIIVLGLMVTAWKYPARFDALWESKWAVSLLFMCFVSYFCSEILFDRGLIKQPLQLLYGDPDWKLPYSTNIEESLETLGGTFLLLSGLVFVRSIKLQKNA